MASTAAAAPRVAVIGGGVSGTLCSLVLQHRGVVPLVIDQGRYSVGGRLCRGGAQILRASDPRLAAVYETFCQREGLLESLNGNKNEHLQARLGVLGSSGGGFLSLKNIPRFRSSNSNNSGDDGNDNTLFLNDRSKATDHGDFCNFIEGATSSTSTYVGDLENLCSSILERSGIASLSSTKVTNATPGPQGWQLQMEQYDSGSSAIGSSTTSTMQEQFDGLVVASHDASFASRIVQNIANAEIDAGAATQVNDETSSTAALVLEKLQTLSRDLQKVRDTGKMPLYTLRVVLPSDEESLIPFDAVSVPGSSAIQFLSRRHNVWTAVSTSRLAAQLLAEDGHDEQARHQKAHDILTKEFEKLMAPYFNDAIPESVTVKRWGAALTQTSLRAQHDCIALQPWRLTICGDYIRDMDVHPTPLEAAALSGLAAGEQTALYFLDAAGESS